MSEKESYLQTKDREHKTTLRVLRAYPVEKLDFKPHEKSKSARDLAWGFAGEELVNNMALAGKIDWMALPKRGPASMEEIIAELEVNHTASMQAVRNASEELLNRVIDFSGMPMRVLDALWSILLDSVHHRGQFSVYIRLAGGKVPSIYGPSADEPWDAAKANIV